MYDFAHHRLDAYRVALEFAQDAMMIAKELPRGQAAIADQPKRSSTAVPLLIAEGANSVSAAQKRQRFVEARGECGEAAAAIELLAKLAMADAKRADRALTTADRVSAMLTGLLKKFA